MGPLSRSARHPIALLVLLLVSVAGAARARAEPEGPVRVVVKETPPFAWRDVDEGWTGLVAELWRRIASEVGLPPSRYEERALGPLLDAVAGGEADVGLGAISVTAEREQRLDFSHPFLSTGLGVAVADRGEGVNVWSRLGMLFSRGFAWMIGGLLLGLLLFGLLLTWSERRRNATFRDATRGEAVGVGFWWAIVMALGHKGIFPRSVAGRVLAAGMMTASLLLLSVLVGAIASVLTVSQLEHRLDGPEDLRRFRVGTVSKTTSGQFLVRQRVVHTGYDDIERAFDALLTGDVDLVVYDRPLLLYAARGRLPARIDVLPVVFEPQEYALALAPGYEHREAINRALLEIRGTRWWREQLFLYLGE